MLRFTVPGMACGGCAKGVVRAIQGAVADAQVEVDLGSKEVRVEAPEASVTAVLRALEGAGYPAQPKLAAS